MNKLKLFKAANSLLLLSFFVQSSTAVVMVFFSGLAMKLGLLPLVFEIHEYNGFVLVALVLIHLYFNWGWIRANIFSKISKGG